MSTCVHWLQVRPAGTTDDWRNLRWHDDEADALEDLLAQRAVSQPQWEFRVCMKVSALEPAQQGELVDG